MVDWGRRVGLLSRRLNNPVSVVLWLMAMEREVRLLRVVAVMVVEMRVALNWGMFSTAVAIIVRVRGSPYLSLLRPSWRSFFLVGVGVLLISPLRPLLLVGMHPPTLVREVAVVAPPTHVVMRVVALGPNLIAN